MAAETRSLMGLVGPDTGSIESYGIAWGYWFGCLVVTFSLVGLLDLHELVIGIEAIAMVWKESEPYLEG